MQSNQESGTEAYVLSTAWLKKYHKFIMYDEFEMGETAEKIEQKLG